MSLYAPCGFKDSGSSSTQRRDAWAGGSIMPKCERRHSRSSVTHGSKLNENARRVQVDDTPIARSPALMSGTGTTMQSTRHETPALHSLPSKKPAASGSGPKDIKTGQGPTRLLQSATNKSVQRKSAHENRPPTFHNTFQKSL